MACAYACFSLARQTSCVNSSHESMQPSIFLATTTVQERESTYVICPTLCNRMMQLAGRNLLISNNIDRRLVFTIYTRTEHTFIFTINHSRPKIHLQCNLRSPILLHNLPPDLSLPTLQHLLNKSPLLSTQPHDHALERNLIFTRDLQ